jgi:pyrimidine deaminase RibD-like protein
MKFKLQQNQSMVTDVRVVVTQGEIMTRKEHREFGKEDAENVVLNGLSDCIWD